MKRKISLDTAIALMIIAAVTSAAVTALAVSTRVNDVLSVPAAEKIVEIDMRVRESFYGDIDEGELTAAAAKGYVDGLNDKYAFYYTPEEYSELTRKFEGKSVGIGASVMIDPNGFKITEIYPGSPCESAGLQIGDIIVKVEGDDITEDNLEGSLSAIRGEAGTTVGLTVRRGDTEVDAEVTRQEIDVPSVVSEVYGKVGYFRINKFVDPTPDHFEKELNSVLEQGAEALIFDLRDNPGGSLDSVSAILDRLLPEGRLVSEIDKNGNTIVEVDSNTEEIDLPMVVITNENSASAAEIFAQAVKDFGKGVTVGTVTYGKGVVQNVIEFDDGSAVKFTISEYIVGSSPNFHGIGVMPDYEVEFSEDDSYFYGSFDMDTDPQMKKALELANAVIETGSFEK